MLTHTKIQGKLLFELFYNYYLKDKSNDSQYRTENLEERSEVTIEVGWKARNLSVEYFSYYS